MQPANTISIRHHTLASEIALYIQTQCRQGKMESLRLDKLAREFGVSETVLKQCIRRRYQVSVHALVIAERVQYICSLLDETEHAVKEIACMAGYTELSNFSRDFTKVTGLAPTLYRQRRQSLNSLKKYI